MKKKLSKNKNLEKDNLSKKLNDFINKRVSLKVYELILFGILLIVMTIFLTYVIVNEVNYKDEPSNTLSISKENFKEFNEVYNLIKSDYYKNVKEDKLIDGAINGMLSSLDDPHTSYFSKKETEQFNSLMQGSYEGIGAVVGMDDNKKVYITQIFKNSPASEVGLKTGDIFKEVNGTNVDGKTSEEVVALIKNEKVNPVNIKVLRNDEELSFDIRKRIVEIESVESKVIEEGNTKIGYVLVNNFANNTYLQFKEQIENMEKQGISGLIIDVRGNSGGYLHSVTNMIDMFLPKNEVIYQIADKKKTTVYKDTTSESRNYPISVLIDKSSASASEILAISLKESYKAFVVGTYSYGKGTVQTTKDLKSGGMIKYTIQKWLSPKGNWINGKGVEPTNTVELSEEYKNDPKEENDNQLQEAIKLIINKNK